MKVHTNPGTKVSIFFFRGSQRGLFDFFQVFSLSVFSTLLKSRNLCVIYYYFMEPKKNWRNLGRKTLLILLKRIFRSWWYASGFFFFAGFLKASKPKKNSDFGNSSTHLKKNSTMCWSLKVFLDKMLKSDFWNPF